MTSRSNACTSGIERARMHGMTSRRSTLRMLAGAAASTFVVGRANAQQKRPISILVGFAPGGAPDMVARTFADKLQATLDRPVIVENRSGAGGQLALAALQNGPADGTQYALTPPGMLTIYPSLYPRLPYDAAGLEPLIAACTFEHAVVAGKGTPARSFAEYVAWVKATPDKAFFAVPGLGVAPHFIGTLLSKEIGVNLTPMPYRGGPPMLQDLMGGQVPLAINVLSNFVELHRDGRLRILATTGARRNEQLPDVPTLTELGYKDLQAEEWFAFVAKPGTPQNQTRAFIAAARDALQTPEVQATLRKMGLNPVAREEAALRDDIRKGAVKWGQVIKDTGFRLES